MGQRGPAKKPAKTHRQRGTYRADRHGGAQLAAALPEPPAALSAEGRRLWQSIGGGLVAAGLVTELDGLALRMLVGSIELYEEACAAVGGELTIETASGYLVQHPAIGIRNQAWAQVVKLCREFGLTPSARTGLPVVTRDESGDRLAKLLGFAPQN